MALTYIRVISLLLFCGILKSQDTFHKRLADSALTLTKQNVTYDPKYYRIAYPNGDVPTDKGVCTDVIIRTYRKLGIDLQKEVHDDMKNNFSVYPKIWGLTSTDRNIDHRRVPNLMKYFERTNSKVSVSNNAEAYKPGDMFVGV